MGRRTIVLAVAVLLAGVSAFAVWNFLSNVEAEVRGQVELVEVYRAADFIPEGSSGEQVISQGQVVKSQEERQFLPANAITSDEQLAAALQGHVTAGPISANQVLTTDQWVQLTAAVKPLATMIGEGKQAMTIQVDQVRGVNGFVRPGDRVNMIVTITTPVVEVDVVGSDASTEQTLSELLTELEELQEEEVSRFFLQGITVLAVGRDVRSDAPGEQVVVETQAPATPGEEGQPQEPEFVGLYTLEVDAEQAEKIAFAYEKGTVWLTLVPEDFVEAPTEGITKETLFERE